MFILWTIIGSIISFQMITESIDDKNHLIRCLEKDQQYIDQFSASYQRLPTEKEYYDWRRELIENYKSGYLKNRPKYVGAIWYYRSAKEIVKLKALEVDWSNNYVLSITKDVSSLYYFSWNRRYLSQENGLTKLICLIVTFMFLPVLFLIRIMRFKTVN